MRMQQGIYTTLSVLLTGLFSYDIFGKIICALTRSVQIGPAPDRYTQIITEDIAFFIGGIILLEVYSIIVFVREWIYKMDRFGSGPFKYAVYALALHLVCIVVIKTDDDLFMPLLGLEILGRGLGWSYNFAFNLLLLVIAYKGGSLRMDLVWKRFADLMDGTGYAKPLSKFKLFK